MKAKVEIRFFGLEERVQYEVGDEFEGTKERIDHINDVIPGALKAVAAPRKRTAKAKTQEAAE